MHTYKDYRYSQTTKIFLVQFVNLSKLANDEVNDTHTLAFVAGCHGINHRTHE